MKRIAIALAPLAAWGCDRVPPLASCAQDLSGTYRVGDVSWRVIDRDLVVEAYPLFDDSGRGDDEIAPRYLELGRGETRIAGVVRRRYMREASACESEAPATVVACSGDTLELVLADPVPPVAWRPCRFGSHEGSRRERWRRVSR